MTGTEAFIQEIAQATAAIVLAELRKNPIPQPRLLDVEAAALVLGRSEKAVRHLIANGQLKNASPDGRVQIDSQDIDRWIANNKR